MQRITPILFLAAGVVAAGLALGPSLAGAAPGPATSPAAAQDPVQDPVEPPAEDPADAVVAARLQALEAQVTALEAWVLAQKAESARLVAALAEAEAAGFTAGINPRSREILLAAWRSAAAKVQDPTGGAAPKAGERKPGSGGR